MNFIKYLEAILHKHGGGGGGVQLNEKNVAFSKIWFFFRFFRFFYKSHFNE